jgi:DNA-binding NarL/FixJ family response regulator
VTTTWQRSRCREQVLALADSSLGLHELRLEVIDLLKRTIGFDRWCWSMSDPDSLLAGGDLAEADLWPVMPRLFVLEQRDDVNATHLLARRQSPVGSLSAATGGDLARSRCWDECLRPYGVGDQATAVMRDAHGSWGYLKAWRNREDRPFSAEDLQLLEQVASHLGSALRRRAVGQAILEDPDRAEHPSAGVLILDVELRFRSSTPAAQAWLTALPGAAVARSRGYLPQTVYAVAARASATACPGVSGLPARLRVRTADGRWVAIEAARLQGSDADAVAVTLRVAARDEVLGLVCRAHALTARESEVVQLVLAGFDTRTIADRLTISANTLQDHLKSIFSKVGVRTRRELASPRFYVGQ